MKKLLALLLALVMVLSMAACGGNNAEAPKADAPAEAIEIGAIGTADAPVTVKVVCKDVFPDERRYQRVDGCPGYVCERPVRRAPRIQLRFRNAPGRYER